MRSEPPLPCTNTWLSPHHTLAWLAHSPAAEGHLGLNPVSSSRSSWPQGQPPSSYLQLGQWQPCLRAPGPVLPEAKEETGSGEKWSGHRETPGDLPGQLQA